MDAGGAPRLLGSQWRVYVAFAMLFASGIALVWVFQRPLTPTRSTFVALALQMVLCFVLAVTSDRSTKRSLAILRLVLMLALGALAAFPGYFFGPNSALAGLIGLALAFAGLRAGEIDRRARLEGWVTYAAVAGSQAVVITLVLVGVLPDVSLATVHVRDSPAWQHAANHVAIQVIYLGAFIAGQLLQRRYRTLVAEHDEIVRNTSIKEALIAEAKAEYEHALRAAGGGLLSGQRIGDIQLGDLVRREGRREVYEVKDGSEVRTSVIALSSAGPVVDNADKSETPTTLLDPPSPTPPIAPRETPRTNTPVPDLASSASHVLREAYRQKMLGLYVWIIILCGGGGTLFTAIAWDRRALAFGLSCIGALLVASFIHWRLNRGRSEQLVHWPGVVMGGLSIGPAVVFGIHSGYTVVVVSIMFVTGAFRSNAKRRYMEGLLFVPIAAMATHAIVFALQYTRTIADAGYAPIFFPGAPWWEPLGVHAIVQGMFIGSFFAGVLVDQNHCELRLRVAEAAHEEILKSNMLAAARAELDSVLSLQNEGIFTGQQIGAYRAGRLLGRGGMGEVYEARGVEDDRRVALKVIRRERVGDPRTIKMFLDERDAVSRVRSNYIAGVIDAGVPEDGVPYIAMEYFEGDALSTVLQSTGRLEPDAAQLLLQQIGQGLADVHAAGVLHRDVKPQNIMRTTDRWVLIDFGVARLAGAGQESVIVGTLPYMAPEQARGDVLDQRADLYSLCLVAYRALTGMPAFSERDRLDPKQLRRMPPDPGYLIPLPRDVSLVLRIGLAFDREDRFADAKQLMAAFDAAWHQQLPAAIRDRARKLLEREPWGDPIAIAAEPPSPQTKRRLAAVHWTS